MFVLAAPEQGLKRMHRFSNNTRGFTLIELMVTIAIGGVLLAVGLPSFQDFMANSRMAATNNSLVYSIQLARSTSMERLAPAGVCASSTPMADAATCDAGVGFESGWIVYGDDNSNGSRDANEEVMERVEAAGGAFTFTASDAIDDQIYFNDSGNSISTAGIPVFGTIDIVYGDNIEARQITVSANGRVSTEELP